MSKHKKNQLRTLGKSRAKFNGLETFPCPRLVKTVTCITDEVTATCPVTGQPDWYKVTVIYTPQKVCVESKTLKLYLQSFRDQGHFCENFSSIIATDLFNALKCHVEVTVLQKPRGGIAIESISSIDSKEDLYEEFQPKP